MKIDANIQTKLRPRREWTFVYDAGLPGGDLVLQSWVSTVQFWQPIYILFHKTVYIFNTDWIQHCSQCRCLLSSFSWWLQLQT